VNRHIGRDADNVTVIVTGGRDARRHCAVPVEVVHQRFSGDERAGLDDIEVSIVGVHARVQHEQVDSLACQRPPKADLCAALETSDAAQSFGDGMRLWLQRIPGPAAQQIADRPNRRKARTGQSRSMASTIPDS